MGGRVFSYGLLLHLFLFVMVAQATGTNQRIREQQEELDETASAENGVIKMVTGAAKEVKMNEMKHDSIEKSIIDQNQKVKEDTELHETHRKNEASSPMHMSHLSMVFFTTKDLKMGKQLPIYFPKREPSTSPPLLPKEKADSIPFSLSQLPQILKFFSFSPGSPQAKAVEDTLQQCEMKPIEGETKTCVTSKESMVDFVQSAFGMKSHFKLLTTAHLKKSNVHFQNYTFLETPNEIAAPKLVSCHTMPYPYAIYYCHYQEGENKVLEIPLKGVNGDRVEAVAVCHMDTSQWSPSHVSFKVLKIKPGTIPVCHFFPADDMVWIPIST